MQIEKIFLEVIPAEERSREKVAKLVKQLTSKLMVSFMSLTTICVKDNYFCSSLLPFKDSKLIMTLMHFCRATSTLSDPAD